MGQLTTHVLDTARGRPGAGVAVRLVRLAPDGPVTVAETTTNADGRTDAPLASGAALVAGTYELVFGVRALFDGEGFLDEVPVRFRVDDPDGRYHVPLVCSPWSYATYRGS